MFEKEHSFQLKTTYGELVREIDRLKLDVESEGSKSIHELEERYQHLFDCALYEVHLWRLVRDENGDIKTWSLVDANPLALKAWGKSLADIQGKTTDEIFPRANATATFMPTVEKIFREGEPHQWDEYFPKTGQYLSMMSIPFGECFYSVGFDVTDKVLKEKLDETRARENEIALTQTNLVLEASGVAIWKYNVQENSLEWDDSMYRLYEIHREDFSGAYDAWQSSLHPDDKERGDQEIQMAISGEKDFDMVFRIITPKGKEKYIQAKAKILMDREGKPHMMVGTNWDVTEENRYQKLLVEAKENAEKYARAKASFLANMSHEIRTPMNGIIGMTSLLEELIEDEDQKGMLGTVRSCGDSLLMIINDILDFSKIETGNATVEAIDFDLKHFVRDLGTLFSGEGSKAGVSVKVEVGEEVPEFIYSDRLRIRQVISNFLSNAIKFSKRNGEVVLSVKVGEESGRLLELVFGVKDDGIGMSPEEMSVIFEEFSQADDSLSRRYGGTGLGLAISVKIADLLGGKIEVHSEKGKGSMFTFTLEVEKGDRGNRQDIVEKTENLSETIPLEILVVEDNQVNQKVVKKMLLRCGYKSDLAVDGLEAVKKCEQKDYGLILMDLQMPKMNGYDAASTILSREPDRYIVAMTANVLKADRERCAEIGMKDFLGKPFTLQELSGILKKLGEKAPS